MKGGSARLAVGMEDISNKSIKYSYLFVATIINYPRLD